MQINESVPYLDKGFVELIHVGSNERMIAGGARASYNDDAYYNDAKNKDLTDYLVEKFHTSPLELANMTWRIKLPLFVVAQHVRHRMAKQNHQSLRYVKQDGDYYVPKYERICGSHSHNKQGSGEPLARGIQAAFVDDLLIKNSEDAWKRYNLACEAGVSKETSRMLLPVNFYTTIVWQMDISNLCKYLCLRNDPHAQYEIQELAKIIETGFKTHFPNVYEAYVEYMRDSIRFSATEVQMIRELLDYVAEPENALNDISAFVGEEGKVKGSKRRFLELKTKLGL